MRYWKEIIGPGDYVYLDGKTGKPRTLKVTPERVKYLHDQGKAMLASGLSIPVPIEHDVDLMAMTPAERSAATLKNNGGWVENYSIRNGRLFGLTDIADLDLAKRLPSTIRFTSPWINSFTDGNGKSWNGVITHLALTSRPRIIDQEPFKVENASLSILPSATLVLGKDTLPNDGVVLCRAASVRAFDQTRVTPRYPESFSAFFALEDLKKKEPPKKEEASDKPPPPGDKPPAEGEKPPPMEGDKPPGEDVPPEMTGAGPDVEMEEMGLVDVLRETISALWGIELPEGTNEKNLPSVLIKAMMAYLKEQHGAGKPEEDNLPDLGNQPKPGGGSAKPVVQESPPMFMSLEQIEKIEDPEKKALHTALLSLQTKSSSLEKHAFEEAKRRRAEKIKRILQKVNRPEFKELLNKQAESAKLSLADDGTVTDSMDAMLDLLDAGIRVEPSLLTGNMTSQSEQPHPQDYDGSRTSPERLEEIRREFRQNAGIRETAKNGAN